MASIAWVLCLFTGEPELSFNRHVRPLLAEHCFKCHGPDAGARQADLRLDTYEGATALAIIPGRPDAGELISRITSSDHALRMPPPEAGPPLDKEEIEILKQWIASGAKYAPHWAFVPPRLPVIPTPKTKEWPRDPLDAFVLTRMEMAGITPASEAEPAIWLRRVTFDLTGLPPTVEEANAFDADHSPEAYSRVVDRLLQSPHFGERMAVPWLDAARYADSYGYQSDRLSPTWPWRDWVIGAFNRNLPYDQFIREQLAGDLLPEPTRDQRLATAFNRLHRMTNEGGSIEAEFRVEYAADRVHTFGTAMLGLTLECARCHDHKYDPISMSEYYSLMGFFNGIDEWGMYNDSSRVPTPSLLLPSEEESAKLAQLLGARNDCEDRLQQLRSENAEDFRLWLASDEPKAPVLPDLQGEYALDLIGEGRALTNKVADGKPGSTAGGNLLVEGRKGKAIQFTGDDALSLPHVAGGLNPWEAFSVNFWIRLPKDLSEAVIFHRSGGTDVGRFGAELTLREGRLRWALVRFWPGNAIAVETREVIPRGEWVCVGVSYDASATASGLRIYVEGRPADQFILRDQLLKSPGAGGHGITFGQRFRDLGLKHAAVDEIHVFGRALAPVEFAQLHDGQTLAKALRERDADTLREYYHRALDEAYRQALVARAAAVKAVYALRDRFTETMVMEANAKPQPTYLLARGAYDQPRGDALLRNTPACLPPLPQGADRTRLSLADWATAAKHPLTARVAVNRVWQMFFGRGLVDTSENLGIQGSLPSHPDLLDWLALKFRDSDWDVKALCRRIVLSSTYRQSSRFRPELQSLDPLNTLLARGPSERLSAEMTRDLALAASGLLDRRLGGPPVSPHQPPGLWREANTMSPAYRESVGKDRHRRSLYTVWKRTAPAPNMLAFDAARREMCVTRRQPTNTPLQALVMLNDEQFVEAARALAQRLIKVEGTPRDRLVLGFRLVATRHPTGKELVLLEELLSEQRDVFSADTAAARRLCALDPEKTPADDDAVTAAAWTVVSQTLLSLDAAAWKR